MEVRLERVHTHNFGMGFCTLKEKYALNILTLDQSEIVHS